MALLTVADAAERLNVGLSTVYDLVEAGRIRCARVGKGRGTIRFKEEHLEEYLQSTERGGPPKQPPPARKPVRLRHLDL